MNQEEMEKQRSNMKSVAQNQEITNNFEGYSPAEMAKMLSFPIGNGEENSPLQLNDLPSECYTASPLFNMVKHVLKLLKEQGSIKLTEKGYLPTRLVKELYEHYEKDALKPLIDVDKTPKKELDSVCVHITNLIAQKAELTEIKGKSKLVLTTKGTQSLTSDSILFTTLLNTYCEKIHWGYVDQACESPIAQMGVVFVLVLLKKYAVKIQDSTKIFSEKYFKAFPDLKKMTSEDAKYTDLTTSEIFESRVFEYFTPMFGFVELKYEFAPYFEGKIKTTSLFEQLVQVNPSLHTSVDSDQENNLKAVPNSNAKETIVNSQPKVGRNEPCPCGSGKKFKKCCGK